MRLRRLKLGSVDVLVCIPDELAERIRSLVGLRRRVRLSDDSPRPHGTSASTDVTAAGRDLERRVDEIEWYHTIDLGQGVVTPGLFDHRPYLSEYRIPDQLDGMKVLDVATFDGFWAFELERRGAEVVALDLSTFAELDLPPRVRAGMPPGLGREIGQGFELCRTVLGSKVRREVLSVYELSPERLGKFDLVFMGDLLLHLMNPMKALQNVCRVTAGEAIVVDVFHPVLPGRLVTYESGVSHCIWWYLSYGALEQMVRDAGFGTVECVNRFPLHHAKQQEDGRPRPWRAVFKARP